MINLLIVDDEVFTREGLIEMLPLNELGITETRQAFDGVDALNIVKSFKPNILLTDVRMPRMDGIKLAFEIRKSLPECSIIFMSGYSDKEYLKSAISLKAIKYVEKPIELDELQEAIKSAILENKKSTTIQSSIEYKIIEEIVEKPYTEESSINLLISEELTEALNNSNFVILLLKTTSINKNINIAEDLKNICNLYSFDSFIKAKNTNEIIIELYFPNDALHKDTASDVFDSLFISIGEYLSKIANYYICISEIIKKINQIHKSYSKLKLLLKNSFFYDYGSILKLGSDESDSYTFNEDIYDEFDKYLADKEHQKLILLIKQLTSEIRKHKHTPILYVKDIYYRLFLKLINFAHKMNLDLDETLNSNYVFKTISECPNIFILEKSLTNTITALFNNLKEKTNRNNPVLSILNYIHKNYSDSNLCLEQISKKTFLTPAYICVIFKDYTATTVNKYINEYRIEKAKQFLMDSNIKMSDIAAKVGYNDENYFSKSFKKITLYTPSQYRRRFTK